MNSYCFKKRLNGVLYLTLSIPYSAEIDAISEVYEDKDGKEYYEEEYEYGIDDVLSDKVRSDIDTFDELGYSIEDIEADLA